MEYQLLGGHTSHELECLVDAYLRDEWKLQGGVSVIQVDTGDIYFYQAGVK